MASCWPEILDAPIAIVHTCAVHKLISFVDWGVLHLDQQQGREDPLVLEAQKMFEMQEHQAVCVGREVMGANVLEVMARQRRSPTMCLSVLQGLCGRVEGQQSEVDR